MKESSNATVPAWPFILPFVAFMVGGMFFPKFDLPNTDDEADRQANAADSSETKTEIQKQINDLYEDGSVQANRYLWIYISTIVIVSGLVVAGWITIYRQFPFKITFWAFLYGLVGFFAWIGICAAELEASLLSALGMQDWIPTRSQFNPFAHIDSNPTLYLFIAARFFGLAVLVPVIEELFLRGWLLRFIRNPEWWTVKLASLGVQGIIIAAIYGMMTHPGEAIAAVVWFSLISLLMWQKGNLWDCVVAHAVTNLMLGIYVIQFGQWQLW